MKECSLQYGIGDLRSAIKLIHQLEFIHGPEMLQRNSDSQHGTIFTFAQHYLGEFADISLPPTSSSSEVIIFEWHRQMPAGNFAREDFIITSRAVYRQLITAHMFAEDKMVKSITKTMRLEYMPTSAVLKYACSYPPFIEFFCERVETIVARIEKFKKHQPKPRRRKFDWPKKIRSSLLLRKC